LKRWFDEVRFDSIERMVSEVSLVDFAGEDGLPLLFRPVRELVVVDSVGSVDGSGSMVDKPFVLLDPVGESVGVLLHGGVANTREMMS